MFKLIVDSIFSKPAVALDFITKSFCLGQKEAKSQGKPERSARFAGLPTWVMTVLAAFLIYKKYYQLIISARKVATTARWPECRPEAIRHS